MISDPPELRQDLDGGRNHTSSHSAKTADYRSDFARKLVEWLSSRRDDAVHGRLLDFGCADLLLARNLDGTWLVDGYDEWDSARAAGRATLAGLREPGVVYDAMDDVTAGAYDGVVVNSVFQYVPDAAAAQDMFALIAPVLAHDAPIGIVITDAVSEGRNQAVDLRDAIRYAVAKRGLIGGVAGTWETIQSGKPAKRHFIAQAELEVAAEAEGLVLVRHAENLSTFTRRATFILKHR